MAKRHIKKPEGTLWPEEVHERYGVAVATLSQWRWYDLGPKPIRVGKKFVAYDAKECHEFFRGFKPRRKRSKYVNAYRQNNYSKYRASPERRYAMMNHKEIAKSLNVSAPNISYCLKRGMERFKKHWAWFRCLVRHGLSPDEAVIFLKYPIKDAFREKRLGVLLDPLLIKEDYAITGSETIDDAVEYPVGTKYWDPNRYPIGML